jgi:tRNA uridine 5-carboxymethylaminomethyl modification enzyme
VDDERWDRFLARKGRFDRNLAMLGRTRIRTASGDTVSASQHLRHPDVRLKALAASGRVPLEVSPADAVIDVCSVETAIKYEGYLRRQEAEIQRARKDERRRIPQDFPFESVPGLSREVVQRLSQVRPDTLGQALRIPGVTPAAVAVLSSFVSRQPA